MQRLTTRSFSVLQALYPAAGVAVGVIGLTSGCGRSSWRASCS